MQKCPFHRLCRKLYLLETLPSCTYPVLPLSEQSLQWCRREVTYRNNTQQCPSAHLKVTLNTHNIFSCETCSYACLPPHRATRLWDMVLFSLSEEVIKTRSLTPWLSIGPGYNLKTHLLRLWFGLFCWRKKTPEINSCLFTEHAQIPLSGEAWTLAPSQSPDSGTETPERTMTDASVQVFLLVSSKSWPVQNGDILDCFSRCLTLSRSSIWTSGTQLLWSSGLLGWDEVL